MANRYFGLLAGIFTLSAAGTLFAADLDAPAAPFYSRSRFGRRRNFFRKRRNSVKKVLSSTASAAGI